MTGTVLKWIVIIGVVGAFLFASDPVTVLPFGSEVALQTASNFLSAFLDLFRFVRPIFTYAFYILVIELLLFSWKWLKIVLSWL